jgi:hypothetical protein
MKTTYIENSDTRFRISSTLRSVIAYTISIILKGNIRYMLIQQLQYSVFGAESTILQ